MIEIFGFIHTLKNIFVRTLNTRLHSSMSVTQLSEMGWTRMVTGSRGGTPIPCDTAVVS